MSIKQTSNSNESQTKVYEVKQHVALKNLLIVSLCFASDLLITYFLKSRYGNYIPIISIAIFEWYRSYPKEKRSYYGLCRLLLYLLFVILWIVFLSKFVIQGIAFLVGYHHINIDKFANLSPYALLFTIFVRNTHDMQLNDKRRYIIHLLYDFPACLLIIIFKLLNNPINSLYSQITPYCYIGCLPTISDVKILNDIGIQYVVNMCAEYNGPRKTYEICHIKQLHLPTVDCTSPSVTTIEKAISFMNEAYQNQMKVLVHCKSGMSRSATIVLCHLIANEGMSPGDALKLLKEKRPEITTTIVDYIPVKQFLFSLKNNKV